MWATADAFGHRHKANIGEALAAELRERTGIETLASELTYDLRSGEPDSLDAMVATTFANVAMDLVESGVTGRMIAIRDGKYAHTSLPDPTLGAAPGRRRRRCTTSSGSGPIRTASSATRCSCWSASTGRLSAVERPDSDRIARARADMSSSPWPGRSGRSPAAARERR